MVKRDFERRAFELFNQALAMPVEARRGFLEERCGRDDALRQEVALLLEAAETKSDASMSDVVEPGLAWSSRPESTLEEGDRIGSFEIQRLLGEGGMARVYLARQASPRRQVALKLIKRGVDSEQSRRRFAWEAQALAHLDHPHIAKIFETGVTDAGDPFFAMEYVEGLPITDYCDQHRLDVAGRLELMVSVCEAVQHAHQKGVVHRDLKPANVLVAVQNGKAAPKIIDFGISKAMGAQRRLFFSAEGPSLTGTALIGSLAYMSPEQARVTDERVDTRTDVYSLGILLYELLAGVSPFEDLERLDSLEEIFRIIRERNPLKLSDHFKNANETARAAADLRRSAVGSLRRSYRRDLDWIVLKALEKEPERRYASATDLARDIAAYQGNRPVLAGPPSALYRFGKFIRRNRILAATSAAALFFLAAGLAGTLRNLSLAQSEAARREKTLRLLQELIVTSDPYKKGPEARVKDLLDGFAARLDMRLSDEPEILATLHYTLGKTYASLSLYDPAQKHASQALSLRRRILGDAHGDTLEAEHLAAGLLGDMGRLAEAEPRLREIAGAMRRVLGEGHIRTLEAQLNLGTTLMNQGRIGEAEAVFCETFILSSEAFGPSSRLAIHSLSRMGIVQMMAENHAEAEVTLDQALAEALAAYPETNALVLNTMYYLASTLTKRQKYPEAEALFREALTEGIERLGLDNRWTLSYMSSLSRVLSMRGKRQEALDLGREVVVLAQETLGPENPNALIFKWNLAKTYGDGENWREAEELLRSLTPSFQRALGPLHPYVIQAKGDLVQALEEQGQLEEAASLLRLIARDWERVRGANHDATLKAKRALARLTDKLASGDQAPAAIGRD